MNVECLVNVPRAVKRIVGFAPPYLRFETSEGQQEVSLRRLCCLSFRYLERSFRARQIAGGIAAGEQRKCRLSPNLSGYQADQASRMGRDIQGCKYP